MAKIAATLNKRSTIVSGNSKIGGGANSESKATAYVTGQPNGTADYERLKNKPSIEGVILDGDVSLLELGIDKNHKQIALISEVDMTSESKLGWIYLDTSDREHVTMRVGDGKAYIQDLPIMEIGIIDELKAALFEHLKKKDYHTKSYVDTEDPENLILTTL